jgi:hypothetical protein
MMSVKRLQIMIEEDSTRLSRSRRRRRASRRPCSSGAYVGERLRPLPPIEEDSIWELVGVAGDDVEPVDDIDEVIYGGHERDRP